MPDPERRTIEAPSSAGGGRYVIVEQYFYAREWPLYDETGIEIIGWKTTYELRARLEPVVEYL